MEAKTKSAYKMTEVGLIPEDWREVRLNEIGKFNKGNGVKKDDAKSGELPCIRYGEIYTFHNYFIREFNSYISQLIASGAKQLKIGDLLFAGSGETKEEIGKCVAFLFNIEAYAGGDIVILSPTSANSLFLGYLLNSTPINKQKANRGQGDAVVHISSSQLGEIKIPLPPLPEQTAIANALKDTDDLINSLENLIAKKKLIKQGAMQELLKPKEGWVKKKLGDCLLRNPEYGINAASVFFNLNLPTYLRITDISDNGEYIEGGKVSVNHKDSALFYLEEGDLVFARTGASVGKSYLYDSKDGELVFAGFLIRIKPNTEILKPQYLKYLTQTKDYWDWVNSNSMRSGQPGLNSVQYKSYSIQLPPISLQSEISNILFEMDFELRILEIKLNKMLSIKQGMMQQLLTGKVRLV